MIVDFQCGDTITIPEGCKAIVKDGSVVFEREEKEEKVQDFKDGDIVILCGRTKKDRHPFIFKREDDGGKQKFYIGIDFGNILRTFCDDEYYNARQLHHATKEEKQLLFDKIKEQGLRWNAEEKRVEKIRWRAEERKIYYYVSSEINVSSTCRPKKGEHLYDYEGNSYLSYNYFRTKDQAKEAARRIKEVLIRYHEELGE